jgi:hypothetical protein
MPNWNFGFGGMETESRIRHPGSASVLVRLFEPGRDRKQELVFWNMVSNGY